MNTLVLGGRPGNIGEAIYDKIASTGSPVMNTDCRQEVGGQEVYLPPPLEVFVEREVTNLVCCLGAMHIEPFDTVHEDKIAEVIFGSLLLPILCARRFIAGLAEFRHPESPGDHKCIFVGSYGHDHVLSNSVAYCAAKAGLNAATRALAWDLTNQGIFFHIINPYHVPATPMGNKVQMQMADQGMTGQQISRKVSEDLKMNGHLTKQEVAEMVDLLLFSPVMDWTAGQPINMYGGTR